MNTRTDSNRVAKIAEALLSDSPLPHNACYLDLDEFCDLSKTIAERTDKLNRVHIVLLGKNAAVQFTNLSRHRLVIRHQSRLVPDMFQGAAVRAEFLGDQLPYSIRRQLLEEKRNATILGPVLIGMFCLMLMIGWIDNSTLANYQVDPNQYPSVAQAIESLKAINELLVTSATLFVSVFLVFSIAQNTEFIRDKFLFREGLAHKYYRDDVFISGLALFSLLLGLANLILLVSPFSFAFPIINIGAYNFSLNKLSLLSPLLIALSTTSLAACFLSIFYYFERTIGNISTIMADTLLNEARSNSSFKGNNSNKAEELE